MRARLRVFGTEQTVLRPIIISVLKDLVKFLGGGQNSEVYYYLDDNNLIAKKRAHGQTISTNIVQNYKEIIKVNEIKESVAEGNNNSLTMMFPDEYPFFKDKDVDFNSTFVKQRTQVTINFDYIVQDKILLESYLNMLKTNAVFSSGVVGHNIQYSVPIPKFLRNLLLVIHNKKMKYEDQPVEFQDYLNTISDVRMVYTLPHDGDINGSAINIREKEMSIEGRFEDDLEDIEMEPAENNAYQISLSYTFEYRKIIALNVEYPLYVYNQKLPVEFFKVFQHEEQINHKSYYGPMAKFYDLYSKYPRSFGGGIIESTIVMPPHDKKLDDNYPSFYTRIVTQLIRIEEGNTRELINFRSIMGVKFKDSVERLILGPEREYVGKFKRSLYWIALYENDKLRNDIEINIDSEGNMTIDKDLDMKKTYRIAVFLMLNFNCLSSTDQDRVKENLNIDYNSNKEINNRKRDMQNTQINLVNKGDKLLNPFHIPNDYLSNLDILAKIYRLSPEEIQKIAKSGNDVTEAFFKIANYKILRPSLDRYTQLMSIYYCLDVKDEHGKEKK